MHISLQNLPQLDLSTSWRHGNESFLASFLGYFVKLFGAFHKNRSCKIFIRYLISENSYIFIRSDPLLQFLHLEIILGPKHSTKSSQALLGALSLISVNISKLLPFLVITSKEPQFRWTSSGPLSQKILPQS